MDCEGSYASEFESFYKKAKEISDKYEALNPSSTPKFVPCTTFQYRSQGWKASKTYSWSKCSRCGGKSFNATGITAGCRMNGDGYGSMLIYCNDCGLFDWNSYDDA